MKKSWWLIPCLIVLALGAVGCAPQVITSTAGAEQSTGIWVVGQGETMAVPDMAELRLGVEARAETVAEAQAQASGAMGKVMRTLEDNGVAEKDIQTQYFSIYPVTKWIESQNREEVIAYRVSNMVVAKIRDVDRAGDIIDAVAQAGGDLTRIQGIAFTVDDPTEYYEEARKDAVENARTKAQQLADSAGVKLGNPIYISEGSIYQPKSTRNLYDMAPAAEAGGTPIGPGELRITVNVQVVYAIG